MKQLRHLVLGDAKAAPPLLLWALASFHAATLVFAVVFYLLLSERLRGFFGEVSDVNTSIGLTAFAVLWMSSFVGTMRALSQVISKRLVPIDRLNMIGNGGYGGVFAGLVFLAIGACIVIAVVSTAVVLEGNPLAVFPVIIIGFVIATIGSIVAAVIGGAVGILAGLVDTIMLELALKVVGPLPALPADAETPAA
jgi:hypothetical protein